MRVRGAREGGGGSCNSYYYREQDAVDVNEDCVSGGGEAAGHTVNDLCSTSLISEHWACE